MLDAVFRFDWDAGNRAKCQKHGVSLTEIEQLFTGDRITTLPDLNHSQREERFLSIGQTIEGRYIFISFTLRSRDGLRHLRPISARYMHRKEVEHYEQGNP